MLPLASGNLAWAGFSPQWSILAQVLTLSSADKVATLRLCSVPPLYGTTGSDVPSIITSATGRDGRQIIVFGVVAPIVATAAMRSLKAQATRWLMNPPSDKPAA